MRKVARFGLVGVALTCVGAIGKGRHEQSEKYRQHRGPSYPSDAHPISHCVFRFDVGLRLGLLANVKQRICHSGDLAAWSGSCYGRPCSSRGSYRWLGRRGDDGFQDAVGKADLIKKAAQSFLPRPFFEAARLELCPMSIVALPVIVAWTTIIVGAATILVGVRTTTILIGVRTTTILIGVRTIIIIVIRSIAIVGSVRA
jgi:hypothetical protein